MTFSNRRISNLQNLLITNKLNHESKKHYSFTSADRAGVHLAIIEIDFQITQRNDIDKSYSLVAIDYTINDHITIAIRNSMSQCVCNILIALEEERLEENYIKSYEEYDYQRAYFLLWIHLDLQDLIYKLLQDVLLYSCD
jgi:hypothetical protein